MIMYKVCTQKVQSSIVYTSEVTLFLVSVCTAFSLCRLRAVLYFPLLYFVSQRRETITIKTRTHTVNSRIKKNIYKWFDSLS